MLYASHHSCVLNLICVDYSYRYRLVYCLLTADNDVLVCLGFQQLLLCLLLTDSKLSLVDVKLLHSLVMSLYDIRGIYFITVVLFLWMVVYMLQSTSVTAFLCY